MSILSNLVDLCLHAYTIDGHGIFFRDYVPQELDFAQEIFIFSQWYPF